MKLNVANPSQKKKRSRKRKNKNKGQGPARTPGAGKTVGVASATKRAYREPKFIHSKDGQEVHVEHREFIMDLVSENVANTFQILAFLKINPGKRDLFPWLSAIARRYESYLFEDLEIEVLTESPSTLGGSMFMAVDFDPIDKAPVSKQELLSFESSTRAAPWQNMKLRCTKQELTKRKTYFVGLGQPSTFGQPGPPFGGTNGDEVQESPRTADVGNLSIGCQNCAASQVIGELWVSYKVRLMTPTLTEEIPHATFEAISGTGSATGQTLNAPLGITPECDGNLDIDYSTPGGVNQFTFRDPGSYQIVADTNSAAGQTGHLVAFAAPLTGGNAPVYLDTINSTNSGQAVFGSISATSCTTALSIHVPQSGGRMSLTINGAFTTPGSVFIVITALADGKAIY